jgi:predicted transport protein
MLICAMSDKEIQEYLKDKNPNVAPLFMAFRAAALSAGQRVSEKVSRTMVAWKAERTFATAYVKGKYLECSIDLLRAVEHQHLKASFHTTKKVITNRFTLEPGEDIDKEIRAWLREAFADVGPGSLQS